MNLFLRERETAACTFYKIVSDSPVDCNWTQCCMSSQTDLEMI